MKIPELNSGDFCGLVLTTSIVATLAIIILALIANNHYLDVMYKDMVKSGQDPVAVTCAQDVVSDSPSAACVLYVSRKAQ